MKKEKLMKLNPNKKLDIKKNWKLGIHLLLRTYRFGVNNKWWSDFDSPFGIPIWKRTPWKILENWEGIVFRINACHFVADVDWKDEDEG